MRPVLLECGFIAGELGFGRGFGASLLYRFGEAYIIVENLSERLILGGRSGEVMAIRCGGKELGGFERREVFGVIGFSGLGGRLHPGVRVLVAGGCLLGWVLGYRRSGWLCSQKWVFARGVLVGRLLA